jgi:hypothetical protein
VQHAKKTIGPSAKGFIIIVTDNLKIQKRERFGRFRKRNRIFRSGDESYCGGEIPLQIMLTQFYDLNQQKIAHQLRNYRSDVRRVLYSKGKQERGEKDVVCFNKFGKL